MEAESRRLSLRHSKRPASIKQQSCGIPALADFGRARDSAMRTSRFPALRRVFYCGRRVLNRSRTKTAPALERSHNSRLHAFSWRSHRAGDDGRFKFPEVGRSWTRHRERKSVYSIACGASDVGSIPIARSIKPDDSVDLCSFPATHKMQACFLMYLNRFEIWRKLNARFHFFVRIPNMLFQTSQKP